MEYNNNLEAFNTIVSSLNVLDVETQKRTLQAVLTFLGIDMNELAVGTIKSNASILLTDSGNSNQKSFFTENRAISPKDFLREKSPKTDVERIVCLAYYLTHYRDMPHFKTIDLSTLNTEAAQPKLSNPTVATNNASLSGLLVAAGKGNKQISAIGESFVQALPDRELAKDALIINKRIKKRPKKSNTKG